MKSITHGKTTKVLMLEDETLFSQGDEGNKAYMIVHGSLNVIVDGKKVGTMSNGEVFGEMALLLNQNRSATIVANRATELVSISKENLDDLIESGSAKAKKIIMELCQELAKRTEYQTLIYSHEDIDKVLESENHLIAKLTKQIMYRLERSTKHVE